MTTYSQLLDIEVTKPGIAKPRIILDVDVDAFYAQVEQRDNQNLRGRPVVARLDKSVTIASASYEAKERGIKSGMKIWDVSYLCPDAECIDIDSEKFAKYAEESQKFCEICIKHCNEFEPYGVTLPEEGWLDYTGKLFSWEKAEKEAENLQSDIFNEQGLTVSVGIGDSKVSSKIASDLYKPGGRGRITKENFCEIVWPLPARKLWYAVGDSTEKKLKKLGIFTIGEIAEQTEEYFQSYFIPHRAKLLYNFSHGIDDSPVNPWYIQRKRKSIGRGKTIRRKGTMNTDLLRETLDWLCSLVVAESQLKGYFFKTPTLEIIGYNLATGELEEIARSETLKYWSNKKEDLYPILKEKLLREQRMNPRKIVKLGARVKNLTKEPQLGFDFGDL